MHASRQTIDRRYSFQLEVNSTNCSTNNLTIYLSMDSFYLDLPSVSTTRDHIPRTANTIWICHCNNFVEHTAREQRETASRCHVSVLILDLSTTWYLPFSAGTNFFKYLIPALNICTYLQNMKPQHVISRIPCNWLDSLSSGLWTL